MYDVAHLGSEGELAAGTPAPVMATWILGFNHNNNKLSSFSVMIPAHLAQSQVLKITSSQFTFSSKIEMYLISEDSLNPSVAANAQQSAGGSFTLE